MKRHLPHEPKWRGPGRPRIGNRAVVNGIWYVLWTGCQWKAVHRDWFGVSSSVLHERFQTWQEQGIWDKVFQALARFYARKRHIQWQWQAVDSRSCAAPLGGSDTGKNPTDRAKLGSKIHILVDQRGAPLAIHVSGANRHDKWAVAHLVFHIAVKRPTSASAATRVTTTLTSLKSCSQKAMCRISNIDGARTSRPIRIQYRASCVTRPGVGWSSAH
jgi:transposase